MAKELIHMPMEIHMKEGIRMTIGMAKELIYMPMVEKKLVNLKTIN